MNNSSDIWSAGKPTSPPKSLSYKEKGCAEESIFWC